MDDEMKSSLFYKLKDIARAYQYPFYRSKPQLICNHLI